MAFTHSDRPRPLIYIARAIDDRPAEETQQVALRMRAALHAAGCDALDPVAKFGFELTPDDAAVRPDIERVDFDLRELRSADGILVDMTIPDWVYVGCVCELVYAKLWGLPAVAVVGQSPIGHRMWLRYHADIAITIEEGIEKLSAMVNDLRARQLRHAQRSLTDPSDPRPTLAPDG